MPSPLGLPDVDQGAALSPALSPTLSPTMIPMPNLLSTPLVTPQTCTRAKTVSSTSRPRRLVLQGLAGSLLSSAGFVLAQPASTPSPANPANPANPSNPSAAPARTPPRADPARPPPASPASAASAPTTGHLPFGPVTPVVPVPDLNIRLDDGKPAKLRAQMAGHVTVMQLMFTGCSATCPIQGALFAEVARRNTHRDARLLSFSIDPLGDTPALLKAWMDRYGSHPSWRAAVPRPEDVEAMISFVRGRATGPDPHTAKVYFFDRRSNLVYKTYDLPSVRDILGLIGQAVAVK